MSWFTDATAEMDRQAAAAAAAEAAARNHYLVLQNDPVPGYDGLLSKSDVSLQRMMSAETIEEYRNRFRVLPRLTFDAMMAKSLLGLSAGNYYYTTGEKTSDGSLKQFTVPDARAALVHDFEKRNIYALFLELFNEVNDKEILSRGISDPWAWELEKVTNLYTTQAAGELVTSNPELFLENNVSPDYARLVRRKSCESRLLNIGAKIGEDFYRVQFLTSMYLLMDDGNYDECELILKTYETLSPEGWAAIQTSFGGTNNAT